MSISLTAIVFGLSLFAQKEVAPEVGLARTDITPSFPVRLSGFGFRRTESEGVNQRIWAKALAIGDKFPAVLITVDNLGVSAELGSRLQKRLEPLGITPEKLVIAASHTHTAPMLDGVCPTLFGIPVPEDHKAHIQQYTDLFLGQLEKVARDALADRKPARMEWGVGTSSLARNRRTPGGPVDQDLPVMAIKTPEGVLRGVWVNYACHAVTLSHNKVGGDWPGYAQQAIEDSHPGIIALISIGCGADSNPASGVVGDKVDVASRQGIDMARSVEDVLKGQLKPVNGAFASKQRSIELPLADLPSREKWTELAKRQDAIGHHARLNLARLDKGEVLRTQIRYPITTWTFGKSLAMVFLPGEVVVDYSHRLKREYDASRLWVTAYANDAPCYIPSERILKEGGYEGGGAMVYYDVPGPFREGLEDKIIGEVRAQLPTEFASLPSSNTPAEVSLRKLKVRPGMVAEIVASEPMVQSPVAIDFGSDGKIWVAEMFDYPMGPKGNYEPGGRVRLLDQCDDRGIPQRSRVFLDGIPFPTGVTAWRKGVLVCAAPDILYAEDTNGDGKADKVEKLFSNFGTGNFQARVNSLVPGLDGWLHGSCGLFGGQILSHKTGKIFPLGDRDFRIKPDTGEMEAATGQTQQGRVRDDGNHWFGCDNSTLATHLVVPDEVLRRNASAAYPSMVANIASSPEVTRLYPARQVQMFQLSGPPNSVTAACGIGVYRDDLLGPELRGDLFTCEPVNLLVHRMKLETKGSTFEAKIPQGQSQVEFLASDDPWFRPVQMRTGPDGAIWIVDMHREVIEHPRWIPQSELARVDVRAGANMGRIVRIVPAGKPPRKVPQLDRMDSVALARSMDTPNGTVRDLVMQELFWRKQEDSAKASDTLKKLSEGALDPFVRSQALATLFQIAPADATGILPKLLGSKDQVVVERALEIAFHQMDNRGIRELVVGLSRSGDPGIRLKAAMALGQSVDPEAIAAMVEIYADPNADSYLISVIQSGIHQENLRVFTRKFLEVMNGSGDKLGGRLEALWSMASGQKNPTVLNDSIDYLLRSANREKQMGHVADLLDLGAGELSRENRKILDTLISRARVIVRDGSAPMVDRLGAVRLLGRTNRDETGVFTELLGPQNGPEIQTASVDRLARIGTDETTGIILKNLGQLSQGIRSRAVGAVLSRPQSTRLLLEAMEKKTISPGVIDATARQRLLMEKDPVLRKRAEQVFESKGSSDRVVVINQYVESIRKMVADQKPKIDLMKGKEAFLKSCSVCHKLDGKGHEVGPELGMVVNKGRDWLLQEILDPSRNLDGRYAQVVVSTKKGQTFSGLVGSENGSSVTLKMQEGRTQTILRSDIEEWNTPGKSLMPEGLEKDISPEMMANLVAYLQSRSVPSKEVAGNHPGLVEIGPKNTRLKAENAFIHGNEITFEREFGNIGMWHGLSDHLVWMVKSAKPQKWDVWLDFSCEDGSSGNPFVLETAQGRIERRVEPTGGWSRYRLEFLGSITLGAGAERISLRPGQTLRGALMDLRAIHLVAPGGVPVGATIEGTSADPGHAEGIARILLDPNEKEDRKNRLITRNSPMAAELISVMTADLPNDPAEEYRRIPIIWRVAIHAGKSANKAVIGDILAVALPQIDKPLRDWQAVVIGGGIINGLTQANQWPIQWLDDLLKPNEDLRLRYKRSLELASVMVDNESVNKGTRYDALRMIPMEGFTRRGAQLQKYLSPGTDDELVMGAVSGLGDIPDPLVVPILTQALGRLNAENRELAIGALVRMDSRTLQLLMAVEKGIVKKEWLNPSQRKVLLNHANPDIRNLAKKTIGGP